MQPFTWLARAHLLSAAGDALIAIALAGSLFFNLDPAAARPKVALYLLVTMAPFAVVGPLIGPLVDRRRGGRRGMIISAGIARAVLALLMVRHLDSLLLFPEAFGRARGRQGVPRRQECRGAGAGARGTRLGRSELEADAAQRAGRRAGCGAGCVVELDLLPLGARAGGGGVRVDDVSGGSAAAHRDSPAAQCRPRQIAPV